MLYTRGEIVELVQQEASELHALLIAIMYFASRGDPNVINGNRYGLLQIDLTQAKDAGFRGQPNELLEPETNVKLGAQMIISLGLVEFLGRDLGAQIPQIVQMERFLATEPTNGNRARIQR